MESEHNEVDGMKKGVDSKGEVMMGVSNWVTKCLRHFGSASVPKFLSAEVSWLTTAALGSTTCILVVTESTFSFNNNVAGASCTAGDLSMNSKCYRKFDRQLSWFNASNDCLSRGGSLAVFTDIGRPLRNSQLTQWLSTSGTHKSYWIGLIRSWWKTTNKGNF